MAIGRAVGFELLRALRGARWMSPRRLYVGWVRWRLRPTHSAGAGIVGIWKEPHAGNGSHGLVQVRKERMTQGACAERYPGSTLVRVVYTKM